MDMLLTGVFCFVGGVCVGMFGVLTWAVLVAAADKDSQSKDVKR